MTNQQHTSDDHEHVHDGHRHDHDDSPAAIRAEALESILLEKGILKPGDVDRFITLYRERTGPMNGARVVARAWMDAAFKAQLLADATRAIEPFHFEGGEVQKLVVVENTEWEHNLVVCTLCSCYPWAVLGLPPTWYKDPAYRSRVVREPRAVLKEFGTTLAAQVRVRVWDSSAEVRYLVLPQRPAGTDSWDEAQLAKIVTRDSMIGVQRELSL